MILKYYIVKCIKCHEIIGCGTYRFEPDDIKFGKKLCGGVGCNNHPINCELRRHTDIHKKHPGMCRNCEEKIMKERRGNVVAMAAKK